MIDEGVHWNESSEYKKYLSILEANNEIDLYNKDISMEIDYDTIFELLKWNNFRLVYGAAICQRSLIVDIWLDKT